MRKLFGLGPRRRAGGAGGRARRRLRAETPKDGLVMADFIDDMISLDPAEVFEFSAAEIQAQIYDRLVTYPVDDVSKLEGLVAESWTRLRRRPAGHLQDPPRHQVPLRQPADRAGRRLLAAARGQAQPLAGLHPDPVRLHAREHGRDDQGHRRRHAGPDPRQALRADLPALLPDRRRRLGGRHEARAWSTRRTATWATSGSRPTRPAPARSSCAPGSPTRAWRYDANPDYWRGAPKFKRDRHPPHPRARDAAPAAREGRHRHRPQARRPRTWRRSRQARGHRGRQVAQGHDLVHGPEPEEPEPRPSPRCARR